MTTTIAVANRKGGVAKTTTAVTIATWLAAHERHVVLLDLDAQGHAATYLGMEPTGSVFRVLVGGGSTLKELAPWNEHGRLSVLRGDRTTADAKTLITVKGLPLHKSLRPLFEPLKQPGVDYIIVDCAPAEDPTSMAILFNADYVLCPVELEYLALDGLRQLAANIAELRADHHAKTTLLGIVPQMFETRSNEHNRHLKLLAETYGELVYPPIGKATVMRETVTAAQPIWSYAPGSPVAEQYRTLIKRLLKDLKDTRPNTLPVAKRRGEPKGDA
jgi:chromosome partitioning protein